MPTSETSITVESCLAELREIFPHHDYININIGLSWFGGETADTLARIRIATFEWGGKSLSEAMAQVRAWKERNHHDSAS